MLFAKIQQLKAARAKLIADARGILDKASVEKRDMTAEERTQWDKMHVDGEALKAQFAVLEQQLEAERSLGIEQENREQHPPTDVETCYAQAYGAYIRRGLMNMGAEERQLLEKRTTDTMTTTAEANAYGGYIVPTELLTQLEIAELAAGELLGAITILSTVSGAPLDWPSMNDTANGFTILAENDATGVTGTTPPAAGKTTFGAFMGATDVVAVSVQLLQDSAFNIDALLMESLGSRCGRGINGYITTGTGTTMPNGISAIATAGVTAASATSVVTDELLDLIYSVNAAYRRNGRFCMADTSILKLRKLKDGEGRYIWQPSLTAGQPDALLGYPLVSNPDMPAMTAALNAVVFGDLKKYVLRRVGQVAVARFDDSAYMKKLLVGFMAYQRFDGQLVDAGTHPIKRITMHA